ncbi:unnamed protein product [Polarella glacialis]|uniref:Ubiquitin-like domain-containing protein n=1 Tax=Polarella glacialis TaxID=89957 RepID=A0A813LET2_POLGL|nr:unnamed protein product [Polarella glacialis]
MTLKVQIYGLGGNCWEIDSGPGWLVADVKEALEVIAGVPTRQQQLLAGSRLLKDTDPTGDALWQTGHLTLLIRALSWVVRCPVRAYPLSPACRLKKELAKEQDALGCGLRANPSRWQEVMDLHETQVENHADRWLNGNPGVLAVDDILEVQCHTAGGGRQGTAVCRVAEVKSPGSGQLAKLDYLRCSDECYQYWADNKYNDEGWHHFCVKGLQECKLKMHEGIYLVLVGFYRTLDAVSADARIRAFGGPGLPRKLRQAAFPGATEAAPAADKKKKKEEGAADAGSGSSSGPAKKRRLKKKKKTPQGEVSAALDDELAQLADGLDDEDDSTRAVDTGFAAELKALKERFAKTQISGKAASASSGSKKLKGVEVLEARAKVHSDASSAVKRSKLTTLANDDAPVSKSLTKLIAALSKSTDEESSDDDLGKGVDILSSESARCGAGESSSDFPGFDSRHPDKARADQLAHRPV